MEKKLNTETRSTKRVVMLLDFLIPLHCKFPRREASISTPPAHWIWDLFRFGDSIAIASLTNHRMICLEFVADYLLFLFLFWQTYEKRYIQQWLMYKQTCPKTKKSSLTGYPTVVTQPFGRWVDCAMVSSQQVRSARSIWCTHWIVQWWHRPIASADLLSLFSWRSDKSWKWAASPDQETWQCPGLVCR